MEFQCKEFELNHSHSTMKIGTDAILLSALLPIFKPSNALDIGTGCGIVALCMAQIYKQTEIVAIDIDKESIQEASINFANSKFHKRLTAKHISLQNFTQKTLEKFDLIVANPPFFIDSLLSNNEKRNISRHNVTLTLQDLVLSVEKLLSPNGYFVVILPHNEMKKLFIAETQNLFLIKQHFIFDKDNKPCRRIISQFGKQKMDCDTSIGHIIIRNRDNTYTETYKNLTSPFLLYKR
ncbi:MAG: methyltransferase [Bacteroidales bacterium]|jgi:tRNA1Val (adenine37-N6)-methyltransferase|nr:methyltransferase [Bacteroidales bacterium]